MNINSSAFASAAALALLAGCVTQNVPQTQEVSDDKAIEVTPSVKGPFTEIRTITSANNLPPFLSGITWCGGFNFCAIADRDGVMHPLTIEISDSGHVKKPVFGKPITLEGARDLESVAFDPLRKTIWAADEEGPRIGEHDIATGKRLSDVEIPEHLTKCRANLATEGLAISPDGLTMWTANEETLACDGAIADKHAGATVRLFRFRRADANAPWKSAGEWAYVTDPMAGDSFQGYHRSGIADLGVGADGTLYVLEAEFSKKKIIGAFRTRIYSVDFTGADEVSAIASLKDAKFTSVGKTLANETTRVLEMYEGLAFGPQLPDGGRLVVMVTDGDNILAKSFRYLRAP